MHHFASGILEGDRHQLQHGSHDKRDSNRYNRNPYTRKPRILAFPSHPDSASGLDRRIGSVANQIDQQLFQLIGIRLDDHLRSGYDLRRSARLQPGHPADQFVAKHFPFGWFTSLSGESSGTQSGVTYPQQPALNQPATPEYDGPSAPTTGASDTNCDANHIANLDDPNYGLPMT